MIESMIYSTQILDVLGVLTCIQSHTNSMHNMLYKTLIFCYMHIGCCKNYAQSNTYLYIKMLCYICIWLKKGLHGIIYGILCTMKYCLDFKSDIAIH